MITRTDPQPTACEMCKQKPAQEIVRVQTIPGSLDTKIVEMNMCYECAEDYQYSLIQAWKKKQP